MAVRGAHPHGREGDVELRLSGVRGAGVGHAEDAVLGVLDAEALVGERLAGRARAAVAVASGHVAALQPAAGLDAMDGRADVAALGLGAEGEEVLARLGRQLREQLEEQPPDALPVVRQLEVRERQARVAQHVLVGVGGGDVPVLARAVARVGGVRHAAHVVPLQPLHQRRVIADPTGHL